MQLSLFLLLLLTQPLHSSEQHTRANLEFSSNFEFTEGETLIFLKLSHEPYPLAFQFCVWGSCDLVLIIWHILGVFWLLFGVFPVRYWILPIQLMVGYEGFESQLVSCIWISMQSCPCGHSGKFFKFQTLNWLVDS